MSRTGRWTASPFPARTTWRPPWPPPTWSSCCSPTPATIRPGSPRRPACCSTPAASSRPRRTSRPCEVWMRVVVCTVVHHPADARIYHRQIRALLEAGHQVVYIAPAEAGYLESSFLNSSAERTGPQLQIIAIPRAVGRNRIGALRAARRELARHTAGADLLLVHDPELLLALPPRRMRPPTVWDVHEDTAAAVGTKAWLPRPLRPVAAAAVQIGRASCRERLHLILAEQGYVPRFSRAHPVVPNTTYVPASVAPPGTGHRVVYLGHLSPDRGVAEMIDLAGLLRPHGVEVELIGPADARA